MGPGEARRWGAPLARAAGEPAAGAQVQARRGISTLAGTLEQVKVEDVTVHFSADEWALLEGWQKALHQEVMQDNYTLLLSLGHSIPKEVLTSLIHQPEGTLEAQALSSSSDGGRDAEGEEPPLAEEAVEEGPWELDCLSDEAEGHLAPGNGSEGDYQSSLHLCALMKLVKEIPEFLYGHGKASGHPSGCSEPEPAAEVLPPQVKAEAHMENLHHGSLEADLAEVSLSLSSHPDTPTSSSEGDWAEPRIRGLHTQGKEAASDTEVVMEKNLVRGWLKLEKEAALPSRPCQSRVQNDSPQMVLEEVSCTMSTTDEAKSLPNCEGSTYARAECRSGTPEVPAKDLPHNSTTGDMDLKRAKSEVGKGPPEETDLRHPEPDVCHPGRPAATPLGCASNTANSPQESPTDPDRLTLPSPRKEGGATRPDHIGTLGSVSLAGDCATGERLLPETTGKRVCQEGVSTHTSQNPAQEVTAEEKPLRGLLKSLRKLIGYQPHLSSQVACRPSTRDWQQVPRRRKRDVGSGSPPRPVKIEVADENPPSHSQRNSRRDGADSSSWPGDSRMSTLWPAGGGRGRTPEMQASNLFASVKLEGVTSGSPLQCLERTVNATSLPGRAAAKERTAEEPAGLRVLVKTELTTEEEPPLQGVQELPERHGLQPALPKNSTSPRCGPEAGMELGLWAPYSEAEWRPVTSPLHGLLNCLKEIPTPGPHPAKILASKRGGGGGRERRKGARRGRPDPLLENVLPPGPEACLVEVPGRPLSLALPSSLGCDTEWRKPETGVAPEGQKEDSLGVGGPLQGLERHVKDLPPNSWNHLCSPAVSSSTGSSPDQLLRWTPETGKWLQEGLRPGSTLLQGQERCLKEFPSKAHHHPASPAVSSSFSSSPDGLQRWTPEMGKWTKKEEGLSQSSIPLQGLGMCWKESSPNRHSQPCSPGMSSSISSSPDGLHSWTLETGKWTRKEEGCSPCSRPFSGPDSSLKRLPGTPHNPCFGPAVGSSGSNPPEAHCTPEVGRWSPKEEGAGPSRVSPLQRLENCLKEIPMSGSPRPDAAPAPGHFSSQRRRKAEAPSPRPWPGGDSADSFSLCPTSTSGSTDAEASVGRSPLLRLMSCLQGIPIQRPSYLDTPSVSSSSSSCSEADRDQQSPGDGVWWDCSPDTCQGLEVDVAVKSGRTGSPATALPSDRERCPSAPEPEPSPLRGLENCLKDIARSRLHGANIPPASVHGHRDMATLRGAEPGVCASHAAKGLNENGPLQGLLRCLQEITVGGPSPPSTSASDAGEARPTRTEEEADPERTQEGLGSCLKERPRSRASLVTTRRRSPGKEKARQSPPPAVGSGHRGDVIPACGVGTCATRVASNGHQHMLSWRAPVPKLGNQRWSDPNSPKSGSKRSMVTERADDPQVMTQQPCSFKSRGNGSDHAAEPENPPKKRCPSLEPSLPSCGWGQQKPPEGLAGLGSLGSVLSQKLDRLAANTSALCRDVSRLRTHVDRLEQDARGWVLELATLRMENRGLSEYVRRMESRCRTLENRSRRNNLRLLGLPEGAEGSDAASFLQKTLPAMLGLPLDALEIESARRVQGGVSWDPNGSPRPLVFRLLRFANKAAILQAARRQPLSYAGSHVTILPDFCSSLVQRRRIPFGAVRRTRWAVDLGFGSRHASFGCAWTRESGGPFTCSGPLAGEREGRGSKGSTGSLKGPGQLGVGPSTSSFEQHTPSPK
ncbi:uncharacterized protein [Tiliqua scincoides]|uniref:uncharacterized protein n=1 Tax=Tiliqua scincoides TaxID=71010 RepID=UPI003462C528